MILQSFSLGNMDTNRELINGTNHQHNQQNTYCNDQNTQKGAASGDLVEDDLVVLGSCNIHLNPIDTLLGGSLFSLISSSKQGLDTLSTNSTTSGLLSRAHSMQPLSYSLQQIGASMDGMLLYKYQHYLGFVNEDMFEHMDTIIGGGECCTPIRKERTNSSSSIADSSVGNHIVAPF